MTDEPKDEPKAPDESPVLSLFQQAHFSPLNLAPPRIPFYSGVPAQYQYSGNAGYLGQVYPAGRSSFLTAAIIPPHTQERIMSNLAMMRAYTEMVSRINQVYIDLSHEGMYAPAQQLRLEVQRRSQPIVDEMRSFELIYCADLKTQGDVFGFVLHEYTEHLVMLSVHFELVPAYDGTVIFG